MFKKVLAITLSLVLLAGCGAESSSDVPAPSTTPTATPTTAPEQSTPPTDSGDKVAPPESVSTHKWAAGYLPQFETPEAGTPIVTLKTDMGDIKIMLFPQAAPLAVENFVTHCENGYYDGLTFHRILQEFVIQGGDPLGNGTGGESIWNTNFQDEVSSNLFHFRGALSMAKAGYAGNGSQFFIVNASPAALPGIGELDEAGTENVMMRMRSNEENTVFNNRIINEIAKGEKTEAELDEFITTLEEEGNKRIQAGLTDEHKKALQPAIDKYAEIGGAAHLDFVHTVFGQVIEGMDVVDKITAVEVNADGMPATPVVINSTTVEIAK